MLQSLSLRKNKIFLSDYNYKKDIENRSLLSDFSPFELKILEEILFSSITTSISRLSNALKCEKNMLILALKKLENTYLITTEKELIHVNKKMRKYFEFEYFRFDSKFKPDLLFINNLLQKIPIHILPLWYSIPKTSNNIFQSIIDKYFLTPQIYQRHLEEIKNENSIFSIIIDSIHNSEEFEVPFDDIQQKLNLKKKDLLEHILYLEFSFACIQCYKKKKGSFLQILTFFHEYKEYLTHFKNTNSPIINNTKNIIKKRNSDFGYIEDLSYILNMAKTPTNLDQIKKNLKKEITIKDPQAIITSSYINSLINKLIKLKFINIKNDLVQSFSKGVEWNKLKLQNKGLHLYYHPLNLLDDIPKYLQTEKSLLEAEKSIKRILHSRWVFFEDFLKGVMAPITDNHQVNLKGCGKSYKYFLPSYSREEILFIKKVIFEKLFEAGIVSIGSLDSKDCFCVTKLGQTLFGN